MNPPDFLTEPAKYMFAHLVRSVPQANHPLLVVYCRAWGLYCEAAQLALDEDRTFDSKGRIIQGYWNDQANKQGAIMRMTAKQLGLDRLTMTESKFAEDQGDA